ncbi:MAG: class I SAM-dependent methyltransferase [Anaerolineales bacterium]|nr:class I SAM-dependent methyltransferase [Anaerolineales bacterium]
MAEGYGYENTAEYYDFVVPYRERQDIAFYVEESKRTEGEVLEVGCGTGRVLLPAARAGCRITGLDLSTEMLKVCRASLAQEPPEVRDRVSLHQDDMRSFDLGKTFQLITLPFRAFQHLLCVEDQLQCLQTLHRHLAPQGRLILDFFNPSLDFIVNVPLGEEVGEEPEFTMPDGRRVVRCNRTTAQDRFQQVNDVELIYHVTYPDGFQEHPVHAFKIRYTFRFEAEHLLWRSGFLVDNLYSDYDRKPYGAVDPGDLIFIARKQQT